MDGRHKVAEAWRAGKVYAQGNVLTDGFNVYSYRHRVGYSLITGERVALCCHYSVTTAKHCSALKAVADYIEPCPADSSMTCVTCKTAKVGA